MSFEIETKIPKFSILIEFPGSMTGSEIARMLERRTGKKVEISIYRAVIVGAISGAEVLIKSGDSRIGSQGIYDSVRIEATAIGYNGAIPADEITALISKITDCSE